jgi:hypothetical protein
VIVSGWRSVLLLSLVAVAWPSSSGAALLSGVQTGTAVSTANGTVTVPITSVDTTRSFLIFQVRSTGDRPVSSYLRGRIASATTLEFVRVTDEASPLQIDIRWYVASFASGVSVQRGQATQSATTLNVAITAVGAVNRAFVTWSKTSHSADVNWNDNDPVLGELTATNNLQFRSNSSTGPHTIWWQVIEFTDPADITVQKGTTSLTGGATSVTATLGTAVDVSRTFVLVGFRMPDSGNDVGARMLRAQLTNSTTITIDRSVGGTDDIDEIVWQAVELKDGSSVQRGSTSFAAGSATQTATLSPPMDPNRSIAFASVQPAGGQNMGRSAYTGNDVIGVGSFTMALAPGQITMDRNNTAAAADVGWFAVQFKTRRVLITD